ncbi:MAG: hypothetical protein A2X64_10440 [Ignavibacteria bacterium GWF2_33_9]|nr:MAG: hypothetical protein A2X64_10440 [Ignavibacteria bacterium GWF2_33_9]
MLKNKPLIVDLDGTLIASDILMEQTFQVIKNNPFMIFAVIYWVLKGFAVVKQEVFKRTSLNPQYLPYREEVIDFVKEEKSKGREIIMATASYSENAIPVANHIGIFDNVIATTPEYNLRGKNKAAKLVELYGDKGFDYIGDSYVDLGVWKHAENAILVEPSKDLLNRTKKITNVVKVFYPQSTKFQNFIRAIRVKQWLKNTLLFIPFLLALNHDLNTLFLLFLGFLAFSMVSSSVYLMNDLNDLEADRMHPIKKFRPIASGAIHLPNAFYMAIFFVIGGIALASFLGNYKFVIILISYYVLNFVYSKYLKNEAILDIILLSSFYTLRLVAGGILAEVAQSDWMISFAIFTFLSFAILKRYAEIKLLQARGIDRKKVRGYHITDEPMLLFSGLSLGFISALVFILYTQSDKVKLLYSHPKYLIYITPLLLLFIMRIWFNTSRVTESDNPFELVLKDRLNYLIFIGIIAIIFVSI